jgi:drug/metabolite transporter (DMT)-like permease
MSESKRSTILPYILLLLATVFWSGNNIVARVTVQEVPPFSLTFWRVGLALLILTPFAIGGVTRQWDIVRRHWKVIVFLGLLGVPTFNLLLNSAVQYTTAVNASLINGGTPVLTVLLGWILYREGFGWRTVVGMIVAFAGITAIVVRGDLAVLRAFSFNPGDLLMLPAILSWAFYTLALRHKPKELGGLQFLMMMMVVSMPVLAAFYAVDLTAGRFFTLDTNNALSIGYIAVFPALLAFAFWNRGIAAVGAARGVQLQYLMPVWGALGGVFFLSEPFEGYHLAGIALIFVGVFLATRRRPQPA